MSNIRIMLKLGKIGIELYSIGSILKKIPIIIIFSLIALVGIANIMSTISLMINEKQLQVGLLISQGLQK